MYKKTHGAKDMKIGAKDVEIGADVYEETHYDKDMKIGAKDVEIGADVYEETYGMAPRSRSLAATVTRRGLWTDGSLDGQKWITSMEVYSWFVVGGVCVVTRGNRPSPPLP